MKLNQYTILFLSLLLSFSCGKNEDVDNFGKKEMFTNYADNLILPAYTTYGNSITALQTALTNFNATTDLTTLSALQTAFLTTYASWQNCEIYQKTAPADDVMALDNTNYFPCRNDSIEAYINRNDNSAAAIKNKVKSDKGLAAIEYLLFSRTLTQQQILDRFTTSLNATSYKTYLSSLISNVAEVQSSIIVRLVSLQRYFHQQFRHRCFRFI
jgi:predicted lipoprotein